MTDRPDGANRTDANGFDLDRFRAAQAPVYSQVIRELGEGRKRTHWMWFVFPQMRGLGLSPMAVKYGISGADEARFYLADGLLGARLRECTKIMLDLASSDATDVLGTPDDLKFRSSMTLFAAVASEPLFDKALDKFFGGKKDARTLEILGR